MKYKINIQQNNKTYFIIHIEASVNVYIIYLNGYVGVGVYTSRVLSQFLHVFVDIGHAKIKKIYFFY